MENIQQIPQILDRVANTFYLYEGQERFWDGKLLLCKHKRQIFRCKECGGSQICEHNKIKSQCKSCKGSQICQHNRLKAQCKSCKGSSICIHNREKFKCTQCKGVSICKHNTRRICCKQCKGSQICEHDKVRSFCKHCKGSQICEHDKIRKECKTCEGSAICKHNKLKYRCKECEGSAICKHNKLKYQCRECGGNQFCEHKKLKHRCKTCGGSSLCRSEWCETYANKKYDKYCLRCFVHLFPDKPVVRNYKTKEFTVVEYIKKCFSDKDWINDKKITDGCSSKRPDLLLDLGYQVIIIEIDENQHDTYDSTCENKRIMTLSRDVNHRPMIFIRFNPDDYIEKNTKITGCFSIGKDGICRVKKSKEKEWENRLETLRERIQYWLEIRTYKTIEIEQLFYDT
jgi:hypothetical protein